LKSIGLSCGAAVVVMRGVLPLIQNSSWIPEHLLSSKALRLRLNYCSVNILVIEIIILIRSVLTFAQRAANFPAYIWTVNILDHNGLCSITALLLQFKSSWRKCKCV
jgi:hypothetical protein